MENRNTHIDIIRRRFGITLADVSRYNSLNKEEITNAGNIFRLEGLDREKTLTLLYMVSSDENDPVIKKFRRETNLNDTHYDSSGSLIDKYGTMLTAAMIYNAHFYAMAVNYYGAVSSGLAVTDTSESSPFSGKKTGSRVIPFPINSRMAFAAAASLVAVLFMAVLLATNSRTSQQISNDWIAGLTAPQKGQDGISYIADGTEGAHIRVGSPLMGTPMAAESKPAGTSPAVAYYTRAIRTEKNNAVLYVNRGIAYTLEGYVDSAIRDFNKAIELDPRDTSAYYNRAIALAGKGNAHVDSAIADLFTVIGINSGDSEAYYALGALYFRLYENDEAKPRALLEKALDAFAHIQGYRDADPIFDYLSKLL